MDLLFKCSHSYNTYIQDTKWLTHKRMLKNIEFKGKLRAIKVMNELLNRRFSNAILRQGKQDIFHPTYYETYFLKHWNSVPLC